MNLVKICNICVCFGRYFAETPPLPPFGLTVNDLIKHRPRGDLGRHFICIFASHIMAQLVLIAGIQDLGRGFSSTKYELEIFNGDPVLDVGNSNKSLSELFLARAN